MKLLPDKMAAEVAKTVFKAKANSPHIFFAAGVIGVVGSAVLACRATLKLEETLEEIKDDVREANNKSTEIVHSADVLTPDVIDHAESERIKEVSLVSVKGAVAVGKLYAPAIIIGGASIACLAGSHVQLTRRNAALTAAFTALSKAYDDYRARVRAEIGEEREFDIYRSIEKVEAKDENGKKQLIRMVNPDGLSPYARKFDARTSSAWSPSAEMNRALIEAQEQYANFRLSKYGYVLLNEVYESLGFPKTSEGCIVGWIKNSEHGDGYIDFGRFEGRDMQLMNDIDNYMWLDFNVDGVVYHEIG